MPRQKAHEKLGKKYQQAEKDDCKRRNRRRQLGNNNVQKNEQKINQKREVDKNQPCVIFFFW
jgi:hypothetical protein